MSVKSEAYISKYIKCDPGALYDIGVGPKTEWHTLHQIYPRMEIVGCEPCHKTHLELRKRGFRWPLLASAITQRVGSGILYEKQNGLMGSSLIDTGDPEMKGVDVPFITLDQFDEFAGCLDKIILWMDIEGSELDALKSGPKLMQSRRVKWVNLEMRLNGKSSNIERYRALEGWAMPEDINAQMIEYGYRLATNYLFHRPTHHDAIYVLKE